MTGFEPRVMHHQRSAKIYKMKKNIPGDFQNTHIASRNIILNEDIWTVVDKV